MSIEKFLRPHGQRPRQTSLNMSYINNYRLAGVEEAINNRVDEMMKNTEKGSVFTEYLIQNGHMPEEVIDTDDFGWWAETLANDKGIKEGFYLSVENMVREEVLENLNNWTY